MVHLILALGAHVLAVQDASPDPWGSSIVTVLIAMLGLAVTIIGFTVVPRMMGQLVPSTEVDKVRSAAALDLAKQVSETAKAAAEAATWKEAFDRMKDAHDGLLGVNRDLTQGAVIANTVMTAMKQQLPAAGSG